MGRHALRNAFGVRVVLLRGWDVEFSEDLVDPDVLRRPTAEDVVRNQRFPRVLDFVSPIATATRLDQGEHVRGL